MSKQNVGHETGRFYTEDTNIFNVDEHLFYMLARKFFRTTRQGTFTRSQVVARLEKIQDEVKEHFAARKETANVGA